MNVHERIWKALSHEEPDRVPTFCQSIEPGFIKQYDEEIEITGEPSMPGMEFQIAKEIGLDAKWVHGAGYRASEKDMPELPPAIRARVAGLHVSTAGHASRARLEDIATSGGSHWYADGVLKTPELIREWIAYMDTFTYPDDAFFKQLKCTWDACIERDFLPIPTAGGPEYTAWAAIGMDRFAYLARKHPDDVAALFMAWARVAKELHDRIFETGIDMVFICDDHCYKDRCMLSPAQFERFAYPSLKLLADNAHAHGAKFLLHSDGFLEEELPFLVKAGVDAAEPLEYEAGNRLGRIKETWGDKIALIGNVAATGVLSVGTVEDTVRATKQCLLDAAAGGGLVLAPGSDVLTTVRPRNLLAMIATARKHGTYPIDVNALRAGM